MLTQGGYQNLGKIADVILEHSLMKWWKPYFIPYFRNPSALSISYAFFRSYAWIFYHLIFASLNPTSDWDQIHWIRYTSPWTPYTQWWMKWKTPSHGNQKETYARNLCMRKDGPEFYNKVVLDLPCDLLITPPPFVLISSKSQIFVMLWPLNWENRSVLIHI